MVSSAMEMVKSMGAFGALEATMATSSSKPSGSVTGSSRQERVTGGGPPVPTKTSTSLVTSPTVERIVTGSPQDGLEKLKMSQMVPVTHVSSAPCSNGTATPS